MSSHQEYMDAFSKQVREIEKYSDEMLEEEYHSAHWHYTVCDEEDKDDFRFDLSCVETVIKNRAKEKGVAFDTDYDWWDEEEFIEYFRIINNYEDMKASKLIEKLQTLIKRHGDLDVCVDDSHFGFQVIGAADVAEKDERYFCGLTVKDRFFLLKK